MFIAQRVSTTLLCSEERHSFEPDWDPTPLYRTEPEEEGLLAINIALLRSGSPDIVLIAL
jgi:hypothetical protein